MQFFVPLLDFIVVVIILSSLRVRLVYELTGTSLLLFGTTRPGHFLYSLLVLPGTIIHELSHWIVAEVLGVRTGEIQIFPDFENGEENRRLGSVATAKSDPFRGFLIGIAPFISGLAILVVLGTLLTDGWGNFAWWINALVIYGIMVIGNSMMISDSDRRTWPFIIFFITLIIIILYRLQTPLPSGIWSLSSSVLKTLNYVLLVTAGLNLVMIAVSYALRRLIEKLTKRRIV